MEGDDFFFVTVSANNLFCNFVIIDRFTLNILLTHSTNKIIQLALCISKTYSYLGGLHIRMFENPHNN